MKKYINIISTSKAVYGLILLLTAGGISSCEDVINLDTETGPTQLVVDGWITNQPGVQTIRLTWSASYFNNNPAKPVLAAEVTVTDDQGKIYEFKDGDGSGQYLWGKGKTDTLGHIGRKYTLKIKNAADIYTASSEIKRVPHVDSLVYQVEKYPFKPSKGPQEGFILQFYARDFVGVGDTYWIKPVINGKARVDKATNISVAYDAAFSAGAPSDGLIFIQPLRQSLTNDSLYSAGNSVGVELHSITNETFDYLRQIAEQAGNGGLFATPIANIKSNVVNADPKGQKALGYFGASAISRMETVIDPKKARPKE